MKVVKGDIFDLAPKGAYLLHACNCQGVWGSGIAKQFKEKYPLDYLDYNNFCKVLGTPGTAFITRNKIICLMTSKDYGPGLSSKDIILDNTAEALHHLGFLLEYGSVVYSPKINSGLFKTPWKDTEKLINTFLKRRPDVTWIVGEL